MITEVIAKEEIARAKSIIYEVNSIAIVTHMSPDGDAMGSSLGLLHFLKALGKETVAVVVPNKAPAFLQWLPGSEDVISYETQQEEADLVLSNTELIVCLDFNTLSRIGIMGEKVAMAPAKKILLDHHLYPADFADVIMSYPYISSTSELVFRLICRMGHFMDINKACAECIYTGMMTDTGNFSYNSNQAEIYIIVSELMKLGIDKDDIYRKVFNTYSADRMRLMGYCLYKKMKLYPEYQTALITLTGKELFPFHFKPGDAEGLVNLPLSIDGINFSVMMREDKDKIKLSFRSQGKFPSNIMAAEFFGGGGHLNAAGGESYISMDETIKKFEEALPSYYETHKEQ